MRYFAVLGLLALIGSSCHLICCFEVVDLVVSSSEVPAGEPVVVWVNVENGGDTSGTYMVELMIDGVKEQSQVITLDAGEREAISFSVVKTEMKTYLVSVGYLSTTFTVVEPCQEVIPELDTLPPYYRLSVPVVNTTVVVPQYYEDEDEWEDGYAGGLCYLASFGMLALYDDANLDFSDVVAYSGLGSTVNCGIGGELGVGYGIGGIVNAADNLGYRLALGVEKGGNVGADFESRGLEITMFGNEDEALYGLFSIIASAIPVMVHLNSYYVRDDLAKVTFKWAINDKSQSSHFMVVTGYDYPAGYIYLNDMSGYSVEEGKDMPVTIAHFLKAWKEGAHTTWGAQNGPYWMLYLQERSQGKSSAEIKSWNKEISVNAASLIRSYASTAPIVGNLTFVAELALSRAQFAVFLHKTQSKDAALLYEQAAEGYRTLATASDLTTALYEIARLEEEAHGQY